MNLSAKQNRITDVKNKLMIIGGKGGGYRVGREINWKMLIGLTQHTTRCSDSSNQPKKDLFTSHTTVKAEAILIQISL